MNGREERAAEANARAQQEANAEHLTREAAHALTRAAEAWDRIGVDSNRDDCYRARRLLPGELP